uniref:Uncharacterized protein n=2 Tax=Clytia hemisphaerica TaxID=252671 RepID=A0A7M5X160_9CNID
GKKKKHVLKSKDGVKLYDGSTTSSSSESSDNQDPEPDQDFLSFLVEDDTILDFIKGDESLRRQSERFQVFNSRSSLIQFRSCAEKEASIIGMDGLIHTYSCRLVHNKFVIPIKSNPDDLASLRGTERLRLPFLRGSYFDTVECLLVPEIYTYFIMKRENLSYRDATQYMYGKFQPTVFHIMLLENEQLYSTKPYPKVNGTITIQSSDGDLFSQNTDGIVIKTDSEMNPINLPNFRSWKDSLGMVPNVDLRKLLAKGDVDYSKLEPSEKCRSKYIFYLVACDNEDDLRKATHSLVRLADNLKCRSLSISPILFHGIKKKDVANLYIQALEQDNIQNLRLVRFIGQRGNLGA